MRQIYINKWSEVVDATHSKYVLSDTVKPGELLHVHNCFAHAPEREINDIIHMGVRNGVGDILVRARGGAVAKEGVTNLNDFFVGEGDRIFAYFPDAGNGHTIELHVVGCLLSVDEYREKGE